MLVSRISGFRFINYNDGVKRSGNQFVINRQPTVDTVSFSGKLPNVFDKYKTYERIFDGYEISVHNRDISKRLKEEYSAESFKNLFAFAKKKGTFNLNINSDTHYIKTSMIDPKENPLMSKLVWVTDSCRYMPILKDLYPDAAVPLMENISKFYKNQERNFTRVINNPLEYELNHDWAYTAKYGIGHVFNPNNMRTHMWFPHTRLESAGLYLKTMGELISEGLEGAQYGYKSSKQVSRNSVDSIANVTAYLKSIVYPYAKSTGAWEEKTFDITPSSDVAIINDGFRKIINLMYEPTENQELLKLRTRILSSKNGEVFKDEKGLREMLKWGEERIRLNSLEEVPANGGRSLDGALSFIPQSETFSENPIINAKEIMKRIALLEHGDAKSPEIVREHGVIRYSGDRYLNMSAGHKVDHEAKLPEKTEAQWFMTADIAKSYGVAAQKLLDKIETSYLESNNREIALLRKIMAKETEYINRAYARVTGLNSYKANGKECPAFQVPEAYQAVTNSKGEILFVPGTHTPLGWAQASLYDASKLFLENLQRFESIIKL